MRPLTKNELKEVFRHTAVYADIPAGVSAIFAARDVFADQTEE